MMSMIFAFFFALVRSQEPAAQCVSGNITFDPKRMYALGGSDNQLDVSVYDFTIDYGSQNVKRNPNGKGLQVNLVKASNNNGLGVRLSSTRFIQYAKITARMSAIAVSGAVTTFITYSPRKDEIDWEFVGGEKSSVESNVFYKGIAEFGVRSKTHPSGPIDQVRSYTIDWRSDQIKWSIDGNEVRTYLRNGPESVSAQTPPGEQSFPTQPTQIQFGVWDGGSNPNAGTSQWAGGPIPWPQGINSLAANYESIEIVCYDDKNMPVPKWPNVDANPISRLAPASQPTSAAAANAAREGTDGSVAGIAIAAVKGLPTTGTKNGQGPESSGMSLRLSKWVSLLLYWTALSD